MARPRIFIGLQEVAGYYAQLHAGFEELEYDAVFVNLQPHAFYGMVSRGRVPLVARLAMRAVERSRASKHGPLRAWWTFIVRLLRVLLLVWAILTRDIFIFGFGSTFLGYRELPLLKVLGKRVVYIFHGSDSRPTYLNGALAKPADADIDAVIESTRRKKERVRTIERWADLVVDNPLSAHLHERTFVSFLAIGIPQTTPPPRPARARTTVRVLHSPSNPRAKGTFAIRATIRHLRERGLEIELIELSSVPHDSILEALQDVDVVVDQLYADVAMAGFATEAAAAGIPVVVGGYDRNAIERALCGRPFPPVLFCAPDELETTLLRLVSDSRLREELGRAARTYVNYELAPAAVATRLLDSIEGRRPEWIFDPQQITHVHGVALTDAEARSLVRAMVQRGGVAALCVSDKPQLESRLLAFAGIAAEDS